MTGIANCWSGGLRGYMTRVGSFGGFPIRLPRACETPPVSPSRTTITRIVHVKPSAMYTSAPKNYTSMKRRGPKMYCASKCDLCRRILAYEGSRSASQIPSFLNFRKNMPGGRRAGRPRKANKRSKPVHINSVLVFGQSNTSPVPPQEWSMMPCFESRTGAPEVCSTRNAARRISERDFITVFEAGRCQTQSGPPVHSQAANCPDDPVSGQLLRPGTGPLDT